MSVINKMLRDLDQRNQPTDDAAPGRGAPVDHGTSSVGQSAARKSRRSTSSQGETRWVKVMLPGMVVIMALTVWEWQVGDLDKLQRAFTGQQRPMAPPPLPKILEVTGTNAAAPNPAPSATKVAKAPPVATPAVAKAAPVEVAVTPATVSAKAVAAPVTVTPPAAPTKGKRPMAIAAHTAPEPGRAQSSAPTAAGQTTAATAAATVASEPLAAAQTPAAPDAAQRQQQTIRDALAQAQSQWNSGARAPAIELLQQALVAAERAASASPGAASQANLASVVRELSRMQLAEGRAGAVWDMTVRLEPLLRADPDVWAVRANAAQRLGRHQDSVHAYLIALQTRPTEQRWMLGAAVSLAALGQTGGATEMVDKARAVGPISKDVTTYLRQMGVTVREP